MDITQGIIHIATTIRIDTIGRIGTMATIGLTIGAAAIVITAITAIIGIELAFLGNSRSNWLEGNFEPVSFSALA